MTMSLHERLGDHDPVAEYDMTRQGATFLRHLLYVHLDEATDEVEKAYWQARIDSVRREDEQVRSTWTVAQMVALQDRWSAEADHVEAWRAATGWVKR